MFQLQKRLLALENRGKVGLISVCIISGRAVRAAASKGGSCKLGVVNNTLLYHSVKFQAPKIGSLMGHGMSLVHHAEIRKANQVRIPRKLSGIKAPSEQTLT